MGQQKDMNFVFIFLILVKVSLVLKVNGQAEPLSPKFSSNDLCDEKQNYEVFNGTVCSLSADNIIDIETKKETKDNEENQNSDFIAAKGDYSMCQRNCFRDQQCQNFTYFHHTDEINGVYTYKCILFRDCGRQLKCVTCITGPPAPPQPKNCERMKEILAEVIETSNDVDLTGEQLGKLIQKELESDRRADFWSNVLGATAPSERANKVMEVLGLKSEDNASENISGEDFSSDSNEDDNAIEDFGSLINAAPDDPKKNTMHQLMSSVENIQKSVNQLAAAVAVTKSIDSAVTPGPDSSVATTSRRSVDIERLIANKKGQGNPNSSNVKSGTKGGRKKKERKTRKNKGKKSKNQKTRQPKQLEDEFDDTDDENEDDDYVDPFNVDDGLLQDENVVEEFPDEDEDEMENSNDDEPNVPKLPEEEDDYDDDYVEPESDEIPEEEEIDDEEDETEDGTDPNDDAETVDGNGKKPRRRPTFFHCIMGGYGPFGPIRNIGHIGFGAVVPVVTRRIRPRVPKLIASIPTTFPLGLQGTYTTMLRGSMYLCSPGAATTTTTRIRSFFDFGPIVQERPTTKMESGRCSVYSTGLNTWQPFGSTMNTYRAGGSMTRIGKFIIATGGRRFPSSRFPTESIRSNGRSFSSNRRSFGSTQRNFGRTRFVTSPSFFLSRFKRQTADIDPGLNTIEVLSTRKPGKWRALTKFKLPNSTYDHCTVSVNKTSMMIIGGFGQESEAAIVDLKYKTYQHLEPLKQPRRQHSCTKVRFNGRNGIVVAGGSSDANPSLSSLEFFDLNTKKWYSLGRMRQGRRYPAITLMNGKLLVTGGESTDALGQTVIYDSMEMLKGRRWARLRQRLPEERSRFSIQRIPQKFLLT